jgi:hypothetical protein
LARIEHRAIREGLRAGMFADAQIIVGNAQRHHSTCDVGQHQQRQARDVLKIDRWNRQTAPPVTTGIREGGRVEIVVGTCRGDLIVAKAGARSYVMATGSPRSKKPTAAVSPRSPNEAAPDEFFSLGHTQPDRTDPRHSRC